jgi:uncharacterized BrkB/YihY/UPF0761 family membrane protein
MSDERRDRERASSSRGAAWVCGVRRYHDAEERFRQERDRLEQKPFFGFVLASVRRFGEIEGKHLAIVIAMNLFVAGIPLLIVGYAVLEAFNPNHNFGQVLVTMFHLDGGTAHTVDNTFTNARSGKSVALSIGVISLLITGFDISATVQVAYARAFKMTPLRGVQKYVRGAVWLLVLLVLTGLLLTLRYWVAQHSKWVLLGALPLSLAIEFGFFVITPRLLLDLPFAWRDLVPGAAVCAGVSVFVHAFVAYSLRNWFAEYSHAYGAFGIALAILAAVGIIAAFWVWIAATMGVFWERKAGSTTVIAMEQVSAALGAPHDGSPRVTPDE